MATIQGNIRLASALRAFDVVSGVTGLTREYFNANLGQDVLQILSGSSGILTCDKAWQISGSLASTTITHDLFALPSGAIGEALTARVKLIIVDNLSTTGPLIIGNASTNQFLGPLGASAHTYRIGPAAVINGVTVPKREIFYTLESAGWTVSASVRNLMLNSPAATVSYNLMVAGN